MYKDVNPLKQAWNPLQTKPLKNKYEPLKKALNNESLKQALGTKTGHEILKGYVDQPKGYESLKAGLTPLQQKH